jgi:hypothetical protein
MRLGEIVARFAALPGSQVGKPGDEKRLSELNGLADAYPGLRRDADYLNFLLRFAGGSLCTGPGGAADVFLWIYGFDEFDAGEDADPISDGCYCFASLDRRFYDAEAEATKILVNDAPPGLQARYVSSYDHYRHSGRHFDVNAWFGLSVDASLRQGVYSAACVDLGNWAAPRWFAPSFLDWLEIVVDRAGLMTPQDLGLELGLK